MDDGTAGQLESRSVPVMAHMGGKWTAVNFNRFLIEMSQMTVSRCEPCVGISSDGDRVAQRGFAMPLSVGSNLGVEFLLLSLFCAFIWFAEFALMTRRRLRNCFMEPEPFARCSFDGYFLGKCSDNSGRTVS